MASIIRDTFHVTVVLDYSTGRIIEVDRDVVPHPVADWSPENVLALLIQPICHALEVGNAVNLPRVVPKATGASYTRHGVVVGIAAKKPDGVSVVRNPKVENTLEEFGHLATVTASEVDVPKPNRSNSFG
jgi:hypothetical protein